jgi:hypothetical protein
VVPSEHDAAERLRSGVAPTQEVSVHGEHPREHGEGAARRGNLSGQRPLALLAPWRLSVSFDTRHLALFQWIRLVEAFKQSAGRLIEADEALARDLRDLKRCLLAGRQELFPRKASLSRCELFSHEP